MNFKTVNQHEEPKKKLRVTVSCAEGAGEKRQTASGDILNRGLLTEEVKQWRYAARCKGEKKEKNKEPGG